MAIKYTIYTQYRTARLESVVTRWRRDSALEQLGEAVYGRLRSNSILDRPVARAAMAKVSAAWDQLDKPLPKDSKGWRVSIDCGFDYRVVIVAERTTKESTSC